MNKIIIFALLIISITSSCSREDQDNYNMQVSKLDSIANAIREGNERADSLRNIDTSPQTPWDSLVVTEEEYYQFFMQQTTLVELLGPYQGDFRLVSVINGTIDLTSEYGLLYFSIKADSFNIDYSIKGVTQKGKLKYSTYQQNGNEVKQLTFQKIHRTDLQNDPNTAQNQYFENGNNGIIVYFENGNMIFESNIDILIGYNYLGKNTSVWNHGQVVGGNQVRIRFVFERI